MALRNKGHMGWEVQRGAELTAQISLTLSRDAFKQHTREPTAATATQPTHTHYHPALVGHSSLGTGQLSWTLSPVTLPATCISWHF
jgi:hypothetical protein